MKNFGEFFNNQVEDAKSIIISKVENLEDEKIIEVYNLVKNKNPHANIILANLPHTDEKKLLEVLEKNALITEQMKENRNIVTITIMRSMNVVVITMMRSMNIVAITMMKSMNIVAKTMMRSMNVVVITMMKIMNIVAITMMKRGIIMMPMKYLFPMVLSL